MDYQDYRTSVRQAITAAARRWGTQEAVAEKLGVTPTYLSDVANARRPLSPRVARAMIAVGMPGAELFIVQAREKLI